jgi:spermidine synthase
MGGLGLGGFVLGPRIDRSERPLRLYAGLEALLAVFALATPALLALIRQAYVGAGGSASLGALGGTLLRLGLAALVLLPPTFLAGGTLGAAARALEHEGDRPRRATGLLYGVNTLGALLGCIAATFWLLEALGTRATLWLAALLNLLIAAAAAALARGSSLVATSNAAAAAGAAAAPPPFVLVASGLVGFAFFLMELVWYRMLGPILGGTVYTFGLVLATALLGIGVGGVLYSRASARLRIGPAAFAATCLLEAGLVAAPYALGDRLALLALSLRPLPAEAAGLSSFLTGWAAVTAIVVLPASIVAGVQLPLLVALLGPGREGVGRHIGRVYFCNTAGAIAGALLGGFVLLPRMTAPGCWRVAALVLCGLGAAAAMRAGPFRVRLGATAAAVAILGALSIAAGPTAAWRHSSIGAGRAAAPEARGANAERAFLHEARRTLVWEQEGIESSVGVQAVAAYSLLVNGKVDGNARNDAPTQVMGGLLGSLLQPELRRALVVGLGTGSTAGWLAALPGLERVDVVELEPAVEHAARLCSAVNLAALDNPRVVMRHGDAREALMTDRDRYDLIFSEPSNPYRAGVASLFTREFYEAALSRLGPDGVFIQWLQAYEVDEGTVSTILATLAATFPEVEVWQVHHIDLALVASRRPLRHSADALRARVSEEPLRRALRVAWRATELEDALARFVAGPALARSVLEAGAALNTDDRNLVEFAFARSLSRAGLFEVPRLRQRALALGADRPAIEGRVDWDRVSRQRLAIHTLAGYAPPLPHGATAAQAARARAHADYVAGELLAAVRGFGDEPPEGVVEAALFAEGLADAGDGGAVPHIEAVHEVEPTEAEAVTARLAFRLGQFELARNALVSAFLHYRDDPWPSQVSMARALALAEELATARPEMAPVLEEALARPFAAAALDEPRRLVRLRIASRQPLTDRCREAILGEEPFVPWREDVLRFRSVCYAATRDPRARQAATDLEEFLRSAPRR